MNFIDNFNMILNLALREEADSSKMHRLSQQVNVGLYCFKSCCKSSIPTFVFSVATILNMREHFSKRVWITELKTEQDPILYLYLQK